MDVLSAYRHGKNITSNINLFIIAAPVKALSMQDITSIDRDRGGQGARAREAGPYKIYEQVAHLLL